MDAGADQARPEGDPSRQGSRPDAGPGSSAEPLLRVEDLRVEFPTEDGVVHAVDGVSYEVERGRTLGIVGESGSGKTVSSLTTLGLTRAQGARVSGRVLFEGKDLVSLSEGELRAIRGNEIAMIFQDPLSSLHPFFKVGTQLIEAVRVHQDVSKQAARARAIELLGLVGIPDPSKRIDAYPHEFSGGMRQRAMIAMALANEPKLLIADEPTTALDVTVQAQILALLQRLQGELGMAIVIITHDLGVVAQTADDIAVMYAGRIVERTSAKLLFGGPEHPYTWGLLKSIPSLSGTRKEQLVPISGSPPSLINRPPGCHFHPRCPYSQPDHARIDPQLQPVAGDPAHHVACLLEASVRRRLWAELSDGKTPEQARASVGLPAPQEAAASAADTAGDMPEVGL
ncbi:MAG TPA: ABC transporter ATP-binding protein [Solirubrobacteraceae bacterium]|jgi:peptide/nickel transport system ATP-binding protein|nr:ABC transporter ATP-binding protein [Solirubrobacteraceae bacterium]